MDYAMQGSLPDNVGRQGSIKSPNAIPDLGRIKAAAERIALAAGNIEGFLGRFTGNFEPLPADESNAKAPQNYRNDIECLFEQVNRIEVLSAALNQLG